MANSKQEVIDEMEALDTAQSALIVAVSENGYITNEIQERFLSKSVWEVPIAGKTELMISASAAHYAWQQLQGFHIESFEIKESEDGKEWEATVKCKDVARDVDYVAIKSCSKTQGGRPNPHSKQIALSKAVLKTKRDALPEFFKDRIIHLYQENKKNVEIQAGVERIISRLGAHPDFEIYNQYVQDHYGVGLNNISSLDASQIKEIDRFLSSKASKDYVNEVKKGETK